MWAHTHVLRLMTEQQQVLFEEAQQGREQRLPSSYHLRMTHTKTISVCNNLYPAVTGQPAT